MAPLVRGKGREDARRSIEGVVGGAWNVERWIVRRGHPRLPWRWPRCRPTEHRRSQRSSRRWVGKGRWVRKGRWVGKGRWVRKGRWVPKGSWVREGRWIPAQRCG